MVEKALEIEKYVSDKEIKKILEREFRKAFNNGIFIECDIFDVVKNKKELKLKLILSEELFKKKFNKSELGFFYDVVVEILKNTKIKILGLESIHNDSVFCNVQINHCEKVIPLKHVSNTNLLRVKRLLVGECL